MVTEFREAEASDAAALREVAANSLSASYGDLLDTDVLDVAVEQWYGDDAIEAKLEGEDWLVVVADAEGTVLGFSQVAFYGDTDDTATIQWLHVTPARRNEGVGTGLLRETERLLEDRGVARVEGEVLAGNEAGVAFYEAHGYERHAESDVEVAGTPHVEQSFVRVLGEDDSLRDERELADGRTVYVDRSDPERGSQGPFYPLYTDEGHADRYGWLCGNDESLETAVGSMGRIQCSDCGNQSQATRWDAVYL